MLPAMMLLARRSLAPAIRRLGHRCGCSTGCSSSTCRIIPRHGGWFFNPFAWQLLFVIGFILGQCQRAAESRLPFNPLALLGLRPSIWSLAYFWVPFDWLINFQPHRAAATIWGFDKGYVALPRLLHVLALGYVVMMSPLGRLDAPHPANQLPDRHGPPFAAGLLRRLALSMTGAIVRHEWGGSFVHDTVIIASGLALMGLLALALDGRKPAPPKPLTEPRPATT